MRSRVMLAEASRKRARENWVAVKELNSSYYVGEPY